MDQFHKTTMRKPGVKSMVHLKKIRHEANAEFDKIKKDVREVLNFLKRHCPEATLCFVKITPPHWWSIQARFLAKRPDYHIVVRLRKE